MGVSYGQQGIRRLFGSFESTEYTARESQGRKSRVRQGQLLTVATEEDDRDAPCYVRCHRRLLGVKGAARGNGCCS